LDNKEFLAEEEEEEFQDDRESSGEIGEHILAEDYKQLREDFLMLKSFIMSNMTTLERHIPININRLLEYTPPPIEEAQADAAAQTTPYGNQMDFHACLQKIILYFQKTRRHFALIIFYLNIPVEIKEELGERRQEVVKEISLSLKQHLRETDKVFFLEGFEFALILPKIRRIGARIVAEKMRLLLKDRAIEILSLRDEPEVNTAIGLFDNHWALVPEKFLPEVYKTLSRIRDLGGDQILITPTYIPLLSSNVSKKR
jgi:GGDEF domain-containing protein